MISCCVKDFAIELFISAASGCLEDQQENSFVANAHQASLSLFINKPIKNQVVSFPHTLGEENPPGQCAFFGETTFVPYCLAGWELTQRLWFVRTLL